MNNFIKLCDLRLGEGATVIEILPVCRIGDRLYDLGLTEGSRVRCLFRSPSGGMKAYLIRGACIALRDEDAAGVLVSVCEPSENACVEKAIGGDSDGLD